MFVSKPRGLVSKLWSLIRESVLSRRQKLKKKGFKNFTEKIHNSIIVLLFFGLAAVGALLAVLCNQASTKT